MPAKLQRFFLYLAYAIPFSMIIGRAPAEIIMGIVTIGFLIHSTMKRDFSWLGQPWMKLALVTWGYLILCGLLSIYDVGAGVGRGIEWLRFPLFAAAFSHWLLPLDHDFKYLRRMLVILLPLVVIDTLVQFITGTSLSGYPRGSYMGRLTGPFGKEEMVVGNYLGRLAWPAIGLVFAAVIPMINRDGWKNKLWLLAPLGFASLLGVTILVTGERMAALLFIFAAGIFCLAARGFRKIIIACGSAFLLMVLIIVLMRPDLHNRLITFSMPVINDFDNSSYGAIVHNALVAWKSSPITGVGPKNFFVACETNGIAGGYRDEAVKGVQFSCARHPHNPYLEWLAETGLIGLGLFFGLVITWLFKVRRNLRVCPPHLYYAGLGFGIGLIPFLWPFMASTSFFINWSAILFWWVLGLTLTDFYNRDKIRNPENTIA